MSIFKFNNESIFKFLLNLSKFFYYAFSIVAVTISIFINTSIVIELYWA